MEHASAELSGTVIVIVLLAMIIGIGTWLFKENNSIGRQWITNVFNKQIGNTYG